ncbi:MAG: sialate O-acetylesterase [Parabacteroides sp.]|nr:sialate O-acetylesterase [Parabacteroides sp.]
MMKRAIFYLLLLFISVSISAQEKDNTLTPEEFEQGWELLFDGITLNGWKAYNGDIPKSWSVRDNAIYCDGTKGNDLMTIEAFEDFDLTFMWRIPEKGNSGVIYRVREGMQWKQPYLTGAEYQIYGENENFSKTSVGSLYDVYPPSQEKKTNPAMEWNSGRIRIANGLITHWVNGTIVLQCQTGFDDWKAKVADSKWRDNPYFMKSPFGHIDFQNHGSEVWYKNIKIRRVEGKSDPNFHLYLLVGQSNMAGRGKIDLLSTPNNLRILMLTEKNEWMIAKDPLHFDKPKVIGVGPGLSFAQEILAIEKDKDVRIGLIPCAVGGTSIDMWQPGEDAYDGQYHPYDDTIERLHAAMQYGVVKGIVWHQGEGDSNVEKSKVYIEKLEKLITRFRDEIGNQEIPFVAGELGHYRENYKLINNELKKLPGTVPFSAVATSEELTHNGDGTHLNSESARELGKRMAIEMMELQSK